MRCCFLKRLDAPLIKLDALLGLRNADVLAGVLRGSVSKVFTAEIFSLTLNKGSANIICDESKRSNQ